LSTACWPTGMAAGQASNLLRGAKAVFSGRKQPLLGGAAAHLAGSHLTPAESPAKFSLLCGRSSLTGIGSRLFVRATGRMCVGWCLPGAFLGEEPPFAADPSLPAWVEARFGSFRLCRERFRGEPLSTVWPWSGARADAAASRGFPLVVSSARFVH